MKTDSTDNIEEFLTDLPRAEAFPDDDKSSDDAKTIHLAVKLQREEKI